MKEAFACHKSMDEDIIQTMQRCWQEERYHVCPHTATALSYHYQHPFVTFSRSEAPVARVCISTASPVKFTEALTAAGVPIPAETAEVLEKLRKAPQEVTLLEGVDKKDVVLAVRSTLEQITRKHTQKQF